MWLLLVTPLEQWDVEKWDLAQVTFSYPNIISANFQLNLYSQHTTSFRVVTPLSEGKKKKGGKIEVIKLHDFVE